MPLGLPQGASPIVTNANDAVANIIRRAILRGEILPGQRLREAELAAQLGVSRTPVREAMLLLHSEGLLDLAPSRGATVRIYELDELLLFYDLRQRLEGYAARRAATKITGIELRDLENSCTRMEALEVGDIVPHNEENIYFHSRVLEVVGNDRLSYIVKGLLEIPLPYKRAYWAEAENSNHSMRWHRRIVEALQDKDPDAAELAMRNHLEDAGKRTVKTFEASAGDPA